MSDTIRQLKPAPLWKHFADLNAVPRASKQETRVIEFIRAFGEKNGLETIVDDVGNVIIRKPASAGMEGRTPIVLQSHLDMVHQKNANVNFDFASQGIEMIVEGDWVRANGTTLGADNGIGVASIMALLESKDIAHPPLEALFTIDEETGMTGAKGLQAGVLSGSIMLNLDTEEDNELTIGCAGGVDITLERNFSMQPVTGKGQAMRLSVRGLTGGHSGTEIHLGRGNANKLMNRLLWHACEQFQGQIASIDGGGLRNAIPRESVAEIMIPVEQGDGFLRWYESESAAIADEYRTTDPNVTVAQESIGPASKVIPADLQRILLAVLYAVPNGIHRMSPEVAGLVQTSNNLARVLVRDGQMTLGCLTRSSVNSERDDLASAITAAFGLLDGKITKTGDYPGWKPVPDSAIVKLMSELHAEMFGEPAHVLACHA